MSLPTSVKSSSESFKPPPRALLWFDHSLALPPENLAMDEAVLEFCEESSAPGMLRFWESPTHFVVVGYSNRIEAEVNVDNCKKDGIPILRRISGGGTVLQGPGCLNYNLCLPIASRLELAGISSTNCYIMEKVRAAVAQASGEAVLVRGHTDLAIDGVKFSGNAQRRKKEYLLFHGTILLDFNLELIQKYLRFPSTQPEYREGREHLDFVRNLHVGEDALKSALAGVWNAQPVVGSLPGQLVDLTSSLMNEKYSQNEWNEKF